MMRGVRRMSSIALLAIVCSAHIGSPDAWYDGMAGPYKVLVHIQAPTVIPGIAVVNVRADEAGVTHVTAFVNTYDAKGGTPPPDVAAPVADNPGWHRTRLWVMAGGSNSVTVAVHGARGEGSVVVPLVALAEQRLAVTPLLAGGLLVVGLVMASGLLSIIGAAVREGVLRPGEVPDATRRRRARFSMLRAAGVMSIVLTVWGFWWRSEDEAYAKGLFTPIAVSARVDAAGSERRLVLTVDDTGWTARRRNGRTSQLAELIEDHGKLVHLFMVDRAERRSFAHLHPTTTDTITFTAPFPALPAGTYSVFADVVHASGFTQTLTTTVTIDGDTTSTLAPSDDDSWAIGRMRDSVRSTLDDGASLTWLLGNRQIRAGEEAGLRFVLDRPAGDTAAIEPYLGMAGHAVIVRDDGRVFIHLHPLGTISVAAQARLGGAPDHAATGHKRAGVPDTLYFPYAFPQAGTYTVWVQLKRGGRVRTGSFIADVIPASR